MECVIKKFNELNTKELYDLLQLRFRVFVVEQKCFYDEVDGRDFECFHLLGYENGELVAYLRILPRGISFAEVSIGRVAVREDSRTNGWGKLILGKAMAFISEEMNEKEVRIEAQSYLKKFYESFGFKQTSEPFLDEGVEHIEMFKGE